MDKKDAVRDKQIESNRLKYPELYQAVIEWRVYFGDGVKVTKLPEIYLE